MKSEPLVSVIIPTYKRVESLIRAVESLDNSSYRNMEIIIVDMGDSEKQIANLVMKKLKNLDKRMIKIMEVNEEMYASGAINEGIKHSNSDYILICADDVVLESNALQKLVDVLLKYTDIGIICPVCYYLKNPELIWWAGAKINMLTSRTYVYSRDLSPPNVDIFDTDAFTTLALIRKELFYNKDGKLFFVDQNEFPIYNEEADFSFRAKKRGWRVCLTKNAKVYHDIPPPNESNDLARLFHVPTPNRAYFAARNRIIFNKKYSKWWQFFIFISIFNWLFTVYYLKIILLGSKKPFIKRLEVAKGYLKGVWDGLRRSIIHPSL